MTAPERYWEAVSRAPRTALKRGRDVPCSDDENRGVDQPVAEAAQRHPGQKGRSGTTLPAL